MLDQNYRSSPSILAVANAVISSGVALSTTARGEGNTEASSPETVSADIVGTSLSHRKLWTTSTTVSWSVHSDLTLSRVCSFVNQEDLVTCCLFGSDETEALYVADELSHVLTGGLCLAVAGFVFLSFSSVSMAVPPS